MNLPAGWSCPQAAGCLTKADRDTGRLTVKGADYVCYAARAERFPAVRDARWRNYAAARDHIATTDAPFNVPTRATHVRIHGSGDYYSPAYLDRWLTTAAAHPDVLFWTFTKSLTYLVPRLDDVPPNLVVTASRGGKHDHLIDEHGLRSATVYRHLDDVPPDMPVDVDDTLAMTPGAPPFALLDNTLTRHTPALTAAIAAHNVHALPAPRRYA